MQKKSLFKTVEPKRQRKKLTGVLVLVLLSGLSRGNESNLRYVIDVEMVWKEKHNIKCANPQDLHFYTTRVNYHANAK